MRCAGSRNKFAFHSCAKVDSHSVSFPCSPFDCGTYCILIRQMGITATATASTEEKYILLQKEDNSKKSNTKIRYFDPRSVIAI